MTRKVITPTLRFQVLNRDSFTCQYCGLVAGKGVQLQVDHKISVKNGGDNSLNNLITSCFECNIGKGSKYIEEIDNKLWEKKVSETIGKHILFFYNWWNSKGLGTIDNNTRALLKIYFGNYLGGNNYRNFLDTNGLGKEYFGIDKIGKGNIEKFDIEFKKGGEYCDAVLSYTMSPFGNFLDTELEDMDFDEMIRIIDDNMWNEEGRCYNNNNHRLNYILTEGLYNMYLEGELKNDFSIKKFSYFFNEIKNG